MKVFITEEADRYVRSVSRRSGVSPSGVMAVAVVMELDRLRKAGAIPG
jgi:hypothetical protein